MNDKTQLQSDQDLVRSRDLSLQATKPPGKIDGYSVEQFIGAGAYGEVWSGTEKKTGRRVAIKFYTRRSSDDIELLAREVEKLVALSADRYVVQLLDVDWQAQPPYFVMDYFEHGSLEDLLKNEQTLPTAQAEDLFTEIATGMMHLHGKGIFHCDLKPGNVLLDQDGKPRIADFGQARVHTDKAASLGTLFFMAPEQADLRAVPDAKWDVYALGAMLYCMLVGKPPYHSDQLTQKIDSSASVEHRLREYKSAIKAAPLPTQHRQVAGVDKLLADIIDRAIAVNPNHRFDSIQSILLALRQREQAKTRRPLFVLGLIGPLLLLTVMSLFAWFASRRAYTDTEQAIRIETIAGNEFAAKMAARSAAEKIERYFRAVKELSQDPDFIDDLRDATHDAMLQEFARALDDPNCNADSSLDQVRQDYRDRVDKEFGLQKYLEERISDPDVQYASWFVNDLRGMQIASVFKQAPDTITRGRNYSYRTYFTGFERDLKQTMGDETVFDVKPTGVERPIIDKPHLSAVFLSKGTFTWKVAFSYPVFDNSDEGENEIIGIVACTAEMGSFVDFENSRLLYATLVDAREGFEQAILLEHPVFTRLVEDAKKVPRIEVNLQRVQNSERFEDPVSKLPDGAAYRRNWLASIQPVAAPRFESPRTGDSEMSKNQQVGCGLYVLVAEDYGKVLEPVDDLSSNLFWLAIYATLFFLVVALMMWLFVLRMLRESNNRLMRSYLAGDSSFRSSVESSN